MLRCVCYVVKCALTLTPFSILIKELFPDTFEPMLSVLRRESTKYRRILARRDRDSVKNAMAYREFSKKYIEIEGTYCGPSYPHFIYL